MMRKFCLKPFAISLLYLFSHASIADEDALNLKPDLRLNPPPGLREALPIFIEAESIEGQDEEKITAEGSVVLRRRGQAVFADRLIYFLPEEEIEAEGSVRLEQRGDSVQGPKLKVNIERETGYFDSPELMLQRNQSRGSASQLFFEGPQQYRLEQANYTTCPVGNDDWYLRARDLKIDQVNNVGVARDASIVFKGVPILYTPWIDFPTANVRKSGFLPPTMGNTSNNGFEFMLPYYWNIAPNYDATLSARALSKRGALLGSEFRYLNPTYSGETRVDLLPDDEIKNTTRYALLFKHSQNLGEGLTGLVNYQRVSDDSYFRDLSTRIAFTSQVNLPQEGILSYSQPWWNATLHALSYQTLQDPGAPITPPYEPLPQLTYNAARQNVGGFDLSLTSQYTNFFHASLVKGQRFMAYPSISYPLQTSYAYFTPKIGIHYTHYLFNQNTTTAPDSNRLLPVSSIETGLIFERATSFFGQDLMQTLEPQLYYLNIPFRDQSRIPVFDSAQADVNYSRIFTENVFSGGDRINNANQLTVGIRSRLLSDNGDERLRFNLGQRLLIGQQRVSLASTVPNTLTGPGTTTTPSVDTTSDIVASLSGMITPKLFADSSLQYHPSSSTVEKYSVGTRYQPEPGKVLNLGYRFIRDSIKQTDISAQWKLGGRWHGVGRFNYSIRDNTTLEGLLGFEYNSCCWTLRFVVHRLTTATSEATTAAFLQLELNGLSKLGSNPLTVLRRSIPGYTKTTQPIISNEP